MLWYHVYMEYNEMKCDNIIIFVCYGFYVVADHNFLFLKQIMIAVPALLAAGCWPIIELH